MPRANLRRALFAAFLAQLPIILAARSADAQVNVETFRSDLKNQPYFFSLEGSFTGMLGNTRGGVVGASVFGGVKRGNHLIFAKAQGDYAAFSGKTSVFKSFAHLRYNYEIRRFLYAEVFSQVQQDKFQRLALRNVEGVGPRFGILQTKALELYYGTAYMFEYEVVSQEKGGPAPVGTVAHRWSNYVSIMLNIDERTRFTSVLYVQPRFDDFTDLRLLNETSFGVKLKSPLSLKLGVVVRYDSKPPASVFPADLEAKNSIAVTF
jgi:hypothetical protein